MKKLKVCVVGLGAFSDDFIELFRDHPDVGEVSVADIVPERITEACEKHGIKRYFTSFEDAIENGKDIDCIAIFTQRHLHGPMVLKALEAGKNVYSAVPIACTVEEIGEIIDAVKRSGRVYMMGETCYYYPCAIYCRQKYAEGGFGKFVYGESQYYHDMHEMSVDFKRSGGEHWQRAAGIPPMFYPTHSVSMLFSAIGEHATKVTCFGMRDFHDDGVYGEGKNFWDNPFSNETAIFRMSGGGVARINEFRRVGINKPSSYITCLYGDMGSYECSALQHTYQRGRASGETPYIEYLDELINSVRYVHDKHAGIMNNTTDPINPKYVNSPSPIQDLSRLPKKLRETKAPWHQFTHPFLVDDFVRAVVEDKLPPNNAWDAARYMIPGLMAHESALRDGEPLEVPDFGDAPDSFERLVITKKDYYEEDQ